MQILKRDKTTEEFDIQKVKKVVITTGLNEEQAEKVINHLNQWIEGQHTDIIDSIALRKKVQSELKIHNENAANLYEWYEENKYKKTF